MNRGHNRIVLNKKESNFAHCEKKRKWRQDAIIDFYRKIFNRRSLPKSEAYVTLCAKSGYEPDSKRAGQLLDGCEADHVIKSGLIKPSQFYGIEGNPEIHALNEAVKGDYHWLCGDFYNMLEKLACDKKFKPAIINYDSIHMPRTMTDYFPSILYCVTDRKWKNILVVGNFVLMAHGKKAEFDDIRKMIMKSAHGQHALRNGDWKIHTHYYGYPGKGKRSGTKMGTILMYMKG